MITQSGLSLDYTSGNAGIVDNPRQAAITILEKVLESVKNGTNEAVIKDENGNTIGNWILWVEPEDEPF